MQPGGFTLVFTLLVQNWNSVFMLFLRVALARCGGGQESEIGRRVGAAQQREHVASGALPFGEVDQNTDHKQDMKKSHKSKKME